MQYILNPFQDLYFSDDFEDEFVRLFSPVPLQSAIHPLFQNGNVVLTGTQGCGKTMLLRLLLPGTRIAYHDAKVRYPLDNELGQFISAGVNLTRSGMADIAGTTIGKGEAHDLEHLPFYFADFFNYWVVQDILRTIGIVAARSDVFGNMCNLAKTEAFVACMTKQDCWSGSLDGCKTIKGLNNRIENRVAIYRRWIGFNELDDKSRQELSERKTSIGEPIARTVECLQKSGVLAKGVRVFIRVDQLEELHQSPEPRQQRLRLAFRRILNRALSSRDRRVHYRVGTRRYGWNHPDQLIVHGSGAKLELRRDYLLIDLEEDLLSRKESRGGWLFGDFATDAFKRRLAYSYKNTSLLDRDGLAESIFGKSPKPADLVNHLIKSSKDRIRMETALGMSAASEQSGEWSPAWHQWLAGLYISDPLQAVLAAAWGRQTGGNGKRQHRESSPPKDNNWLKRWWRKERLDLAVLQLAARRSQRMLWWGFDDLITLSGGNITVFLHVCHKVWDLFLKAESLKSSNHIDIIGRQQSIPVEIQSAGIQSASTSWYDKIAEQPGGDMRRRFVEQLAKTLRRQLREDRAMSYPGANGISIPKHALELNRELWTFLCESVGYGDLQAVAHTTKNKAGEARVKFYLNPVLSPHFQLPGAHTKEPLYWKVENLMDIAKKSELPFTLGMNTQVKLFEDPLAPEDLNQLKLL